MKIFTNSKIIVYAFISTTAYLLACSTSNAQATRTWVSGVGDDAYPCSRTAPGKTFAGAISKTAAGGEINVLDPGGFGGVTITKSITIDGGPGLIAGVLVSGTNGITVNAGSSGVVTLKNLDINGVGTGLSGVLINSAAEVHIENCVIYEFAKGIDIAPTSACRVYIRNCRIQGCSSGAVHGHPTVSSGAVVTITSSHLLTSLFGFRAEDHCTATLTDCVTSGNLNNGVTVSTSSVAARVQVNNCVVSDNGLYGLLSSGAFSTVLMSNDSIFQNGTGVSVLSGGVISSFGNNRISGNTTNGSPTSTIGQQ